MDDKKKILEDYYKDYFDALVVRLSRKAGGIMNAEDIVQDAFHDALKYLDKFDPSASFDKWFTSILINSTRRFLNNERHYGMGLEFDEDLHDGVGIDESFELRGILSGELSSRKRPVRDLLYLHFMKELNPREISKVLDLDPHYIRVNIYRFKLGMKEKYGQEFCNE